MLRKKTKTGKEIKGDFVRKFTFAAIIGVSLSLVYLWQHTQLLKLGYVIREKEKKVSLLKKENQCLRLRICQLKSPRHIERMIAEKNLRLVSTKNWQFVYVPAPLGAQVPVMTRVATTELPRKSRAEKKISFVHQRGGFFAGDKKIDG
jgi:cell division protein FtsL